MEDISKLTSSPPLDTRELRYIERIVKTFERFMLLGETVSNEHDLDPSSYNEAI